MTKALSFRYENDTYVIKEDSKILFSINAQKLVFNSLDFYNGIYRGGKSTQIELIMDIHEDPPNKGEYIFKWLNEIIHHISKEFHEEEMNSDETDGEEINVDDIILKNDMNTIRLFDFAVCAGDGFYTGNDDIPYRTIDVSNLEADFSVTISGCSMEPAYPDGCVVLVKEIEELNNGDIGIFNLDGEAMCKKYNRNEDGTVILTPANDSGEYSPIYLNSDMKFVIQGKVLGVHEPLTH